MARLALKKLGHDDYGVAIICPLEVGMSAVRYMLDEEHPRLPRQDGDSNRYICGRMNGHNVVIGFLPEGSQGVGAAATVATGMKRTFPSAALRLLVGIGGGVPSVRHDVRLGDVVVSMPSGVHGGVVQYDLGKETITGFERKGYLQPPPQCWRTCVVEMKSDHRVKANQVSAFVNDMIKKYPGLDAYRRPPTEKDVLFLPTNKHTSGETTCQQCDHTQVVERTPQARDTPMIFYGLVISGNRMVKNAETRDQIAQDAGGALCIEMEVAGLMNDFRCIVIRGISNYADSHKNDEWHAYGATVAAGCAKELLTYMDPVVGSNSTGRNVHWTITRVTNPYFTGRADIVTEIANVVQGTPRDDAAIDQCRTVVSRMSGFWGVFWVDLSTTATTASGFLAIGSRLNLLTPSVDDAHQTLANAKHQWLLILGNAENRDVDYQQYFSTGCTGVIILTSRNGECHRLATRIDIPLTDLTPKTLANCCTKRPEFLDPDTKHASRKSSSLL